MLVTTMLVAALMSSDVQTAAVGAVTESFSRGVGAEASVGKVCYRFPARIRIEDLYLEDQAGDTLLYAETVGVRMRILPLLRKEVVVRSASIEGLRLRAHATSDSAYNYSFLLPLFASKTESSSAAPTVRLQKLSLRDIDVRYDDWHARLEELLMGIDELSEERIDVEIKHLSGSVCREEKPGAAGAGAFALDRLRAHLIYCDTILALPTLQAELPQSKVDLSGIVLTMPSRDTLDIETMASDIHALLTINEASVCPRDLALFVPAIGTIDGIVRVRGKLNGRLDSLRLDGLNLSYNEATLLEGDIEVTGLPDIHSACVSARVDELGCKASTLQDFISDWKNQPYLLPAELRRLRELHYRGNLDGRLDDLALHGAFRTPVGSIVTRGRLAMDSTYTDIRFTGELQSRKIRLGRVLPQSGLGDVMFSVRADGQSLNGGFPKGKVHGHVHELIFRDYTYHDLCLDGHYAEKKFDGLLHIDDENLSFRFEGVADFSAGQTFDFDLTLGRLNLLPLNLADEDIAMSMQMHVNLSGLNPDSPEGYLVVDSLRLRHTKDSLLMRQFQLIAEPSNLAIRSDYLTAQVSGQYGYTTLGTTLSKFALRYLPSLFTNQQAAAIRSRQSNNKLSFYVYGRELKHLQKVLKLPVRIADFPVVKGYIDEQKMRFGLQAYVENIRTAKNRVEDITLSFDNDNTLSSDLHLSFQLPSDSFIVAPKEHQAANPEPVFLPRTKVELHAKAAGDSVPLRLRLTPKADEINHKNCYYSEGEIALSAFFSRYAGKPLYSVAIRPRTFSYLGSPYQIDSSYISYSVADTMLTVEGFRVGNSAHYIEADGVASTRQTDSLSVRLLHIEAGDLLPLVLPEKTLTVSGDITGGASLFGLFSTPMFEAVAHIEDTHLCGQRLGTVDAKVALDRENKTIDIAGIIVDSTHVVARVDGLVTPAEKAWGIDIYPDSIPLGFINHWTGGIIEDIAGYASGNVKVFGRGSATWVTAAVKADGAGLTIPYTGCRYTFSDSAFMDSTSIQFRDLTLRDKEGNKLYVDGRLEHDCFTDFSLDIKARPEHALAFDLPAKKGELLSGHVYATGEARIWGKDTDIKLDASALTVGKSTFRFSIDGASSASDSEFIEFVSHERDNTADEDEDEFDLLNPVAEELRKISGRFSLAMNIDATPELLFQLMLNEGTGDVISARGDGGLRVTMDPTGAVNIVGTYTIQGGDLGFTVANMIRREFKIADGSQIVWSGKAESPELNVTAEYNVTASLRDLFGEDIKTLGTSRTSVPVTCRVSMKGTLDNPVIRFGLDLPMSEDAIRDKVRSVINTEEMLMRQVVYLLVFGRFYTPEYMQSTTTMGVNEVYSLLSSTITGQINSWLSRLTSVFTMGVNIRTEGEGANSSQEYEAQFQLQPVDRLVINGNFGYRYNDISNRPFFGDVDIEYLLTPNGKVRIKGYTHTVDKYSLRQASTIQGVGFVFKHDFNWPEKKKEKKEE